MVSRTLALGLLIAALLPAGLIHLKTRDIDTSLEPHSAHQTSAPERSLRRLHAERRHLILDFSAPFTLSGLETLRVYGVVTTSALSATTVMAAVPEKLDLGKFDISWTGALRATDKISPALNHLASARSGWVVEFHSDVTVPDQTRILQAAGLLAIPQVNTLPYQMVVIGDEAQLHALSQWDEVAYIFPASAALLAGGVVYPCEGALVTGQNSAQYVTTSVGWSPNGPTGVTLGYVFTTLTSQLPQNQVQSEIIQAMRNWTAVANIQFAAGTDSAAPTTVAIEFGTTVNGDPTPFPSTSTLAHTYYPAPPNPEPIAGDLHFNPAVAWHIGSPIDVYTVSLHELGHALGLGHTDNPTDVMYPYYQYGVALSTNDIAGAQSLYGAPPVVAPPAPITPAPITPAPTPTAPLAILIASPLNGLQTAAAAIDLGGTVLNAVGTIAVTWKSTSGGSGQATGGSSWSVAGLPLAPGINLITISATDGSFRMVAQQMRINRTGATSAPSAAALTNAPVITIDSPATGSTSPSASLTVTGTASDSAGISQVIWQTNSGASGTALGKSTWSASPIPLFFGENVILIRATDAAGLTSWSQVEVTRK